MAAQSFRDSLKEKLVAAVRDNLKPEEKEFVNPWSTEDKASVLQKSRCFGESPIDAHKCVDLLTRVIYLLQQGEKFSSTELTNLFFGVTKLFQATNQKLRRMVYLVIKEIEPREEEVFIVMSCLIKDMNCKNDCFRANSIRVLARTLDANMAAQIDRYLKTAIVDKNPFVASSALVCGITLYKTVPEVVRRWVNEIQEGINSKHTMVQFHALALLYELKKSDRLALHKVVIGLAKNQQKAPIAECLLIRYATQTLITERDATIEKTLMGYLDSCLRHKSEMVTYEAARSFCQIAASDTAGAGGNTVLGHDITHAMTILQIFLTSQKPVVRFGAIKTLSMLAIHRPQTAARCNCDMEPLLNDTNRATATLALTTLLKTGHESNVERLVKQVTTFMSDISDIYKIEVVRAVKGLCLQYPAKYKCLLGFLSSNLREDGTADFKKDLVDALILIVSQVPAAREVGLLHLCEYIEDCEYPNLCTRVLSFLGDEVPNTSVPSKYIRFIYNRLILENAFVRAATVEALTKIAMKCRTLRKDVLLLLEFGQNDNDDEVRDRISLYSSVLRRCLEKDQEEAAGVMALMSHELPFSVDAMYDGLLEHIGSDSKAAPFNLNSLPSEEAYKTAMKTQQAKEVETKKPGQPSGLSAAAGGKPGAGTASAVSEKAEQKGATNSELLRVVNEIDSGIGPLQHSCRPKPLTESEAEYTVQVIKHMFKQHVVLEMYVSNTVQGVSLENIEVRLSGLQPQCEEIGAAAISKLDYGQQASAYVVLQKSGGGDLGAVVGNFGAALHFVVKEAGDDLGYDDDYPVENISITLGDFMCPRALAANQFKTVWDQLSAQGAEEAAEKMTLPFKTLEAAVEHIVQTLNMEPCDKSGVVEAGSRGHTLNLSGTFLGGNATLVKVMVGVAASQGCIAAQVKCRAKNALIPSAVARVLMA